MASKLDPGNIPQTLRQQLKAAGIPEEKFSDIFEIYKNMNESVRLSTIKQSSILDALDEKGESGSRVSFYEFEKVFFTMNCEFDQKSDLENSFLIRSARDGVNISKSNQLKFYIARLKKQANMMEGEVNI